MEDNSPTPESGRRRVVIAVVAGLAAALVLAGVVVALTRADDGPSSAADGKAEAQGNESSGTGRTPAANKGSTTTVAADATRRSGSTRGSNADSGSKATTPGVRSGTPTTRRGVPAGTPTTRSRTTLPPDPSDTTPPTVIEAYVQGFVARCRSIWALADPDGLMIDIDHPDRDSFVVADCTDQLDENEGEFYSTPEEARAAGDSDAYWSLDMVIQGRRLQNTSGTRTWVSPLSGG